YPARSKPQWRRRILDARANVPAAARRREARAIVDAWAEASPTLLGRGGTLCAYAPAEDEPGALDMLERARASGVRVLLPVTGPPGPLSWAEFTGQAELRPARYGIPEPAGPVLGPAAITDAAVVIVPALAVDRRGVRL